MIYRITHMHKAAAQVWRNYNQPAYRELRNFFTIHSNAYSDTQLSTIAEEPVFGPKKFLVDN